MVEYYRCHEDNVTLTSYFAIIKHFLFYRSPEWGDQYPGYLMMNRLDAIDQPANAGNWQSNTLSPSTWTSITYSIA